MNILVQWIINTYSTVLNFYPRRFKDEFAREMRIVFRNSVMDAAEKGVLPLLVICDRELLGLSFNILREFWYEVQREEVNMQVAQLAPMKQGQASWSDGFRAGLPHLLIACFIGITRGLANAKLAATSGCILALFLAMGLLATIYSTWRSKWPTWTATWYGYAGLGIFLFAILPSRDWNWNPLLKEQIFGRTGSLFLLGLSLATLLYWLTRRNPIEGLLLALPLFILYWVPIMEFIPNPIRFWLTFEVFLVSALAAMMITRINNMQKAIWLVLGACILSGLPIAYARTYWHNIPEGHFSPPSIDQMAGIFSIQFLAGAALVIGPILGWGLWNLGKQYGRVGRVSASLIILGMLVNLIGHFSYWWGASQREFFTALRISPLYKPDQAFTIFMVYAGQIGILAGAMWLANLNWSRNRLLSISLVLVPLALPILAMFPIYFGNRIIPAGFSFQFIEMNIEYIFLIFLAGIAWIALGGWTVTRLYSNPSPSEGTA